MVTLVLGCSTTLHNIKSAKELKENKLLTGRFVFFHNDIPLENSEGFTIFFKESSNKKLRAFKPDENGYVYIALDQGRYHISTIEYRDFQGRIRFPVRQSSGIHIYNSDTVINFGTIKINLKQDESSKVASLTTYAYPYAGKFIPLSQRPEFRITQIPEWNVINKYIASKLDIPQKLIRDEVVKITQEIDSTSE
ncbi:MAG: hypothetical protein K8F52_07815 [Candidatus Scalindua rubra]|nr:hypothetical protein [Candidatus Scalindua rubra]